MTDLASTSEEHQASSPGSLAGAGLVMSEPNITAAAGNGVMVTVTHQPLSQSSSQSSLPIPGHLLVAGGMEIGLSSVSLEVMTSGEQLDALSLEGLSSQGSDVVGGSLQECVSLEGGDREVEGELVEGGDREVGVSLEGEGMGGDRRVEGELVEGGGGDREVGVWDQDRGSGPSHLGVGGEMSSHENAVVGASCQTPTEDSRSSSSMGYLEPRPSSSSPPGGDHFPSPKDIQKKLMEKVTHLTPDGRTDEQGVAKESESEEAARLPSSHSSNSLNSGSGNFSSRRISLGSIFRRQSIGKVKGKDHASQTLAATSTSGLILHDRPKTLPAKTRAEEHRHQQLHQQMVAAARKKELQKAKEEMKKEKMRRERDKLVADSLVEWDRILLKWDHLHSTRKVRDLWWQGLPPGVRGKVWKRAIGNDLNISSDLYVINLRRCKERLASARERSDSSASHSSLSREQSVEVIHLDVLRTFPTLGFFQEGGPYNQTLCDVLGAYACYRPDVGYVQGMSFLAGVLLLNMDAGDAFIALANLLNRPSYLAFFKVDHTLMQPYFNTFNTLLHDCLPKLSALFSRLDFSPEYYLIEWIFTIYTRVLPLDVACRVWDMFCRDGDSFLYRTALGILKLFQSNLLEFVTIEDMGQFLGKLPSSMDSEALFAQIDSVHFTAKRFKQILGQEQAKPVSGLTR